MGGRGDGKGGWGQGYKKLLVTWESVTSREPVIVLTCTVEVMHTCDLSGGRTCPLRESNNWLCNIPANTIILIIELGSHQPHCHFTSFIVYMYLTVVCGYMTSLQHSSLPGMTTVTPRRDTSASPSLDISPHQG